jgi:LPS-assembly lipoprotein
MSLSKRIAAFLVLVVAAASAAGCGYRPVYGERGAATAAGQTASVQESMNQVQIRPIRDRTGQLLRNDLVDRITPNGQASAARYVLEVRLDEREQALAVRRDETATRANLQLIARYQMRDTVSGTVLTSGISRATTSYNLVQSEFATQSALRDARRRGAQLVAEDIALRIAAYFNRVTNDPNKG